MVGQSRQWWGAPRLAVLVRPRGDSGVTLRGWVTATLNVVRVSQKRHNTFSNVEMITRLWGNPLELQRETGQSRLGSLAAARHEVTKASDHSLE